jgi:signal transduction histidine kinase/DNA-binding response OmpR family regulator
MSFDTLLTVALDLAYFAVFGACLADWARHRGAVRRAVVFVFASTAIVLAAPLVTLVWPAAGPVAGAFVVPALFAQPVLVLWLVSYVRPVPPPILGAGVAAFGALSGGFMYLGAVGVEPRSLVFVAYAIAAVAYFALLDGAAALGFALAARQRAGASRSRLLTAAAATGLFGLAVVVVLGGGLVNAPGSEGSAMASVLARAIALVAALGYLAAFAPPRSLRRLSQHRVVYEFIRELSALPSGSPVRDIWALLTTAAHRASGGGRVEVVELGPAQAAAAAQPPGPRVVSVPFASPRWPDGRLELELPEHVLFLEDDLELIALLVDRGVGAAEREAMLVEREELIAGLRAASAAKSDFLAAMSHELRTPLNAIIGFSELLREGGEDAADPPTVASYAEHIHGSGLHLLELVNDVLDLARVEAGRLDLKPAELQLDALVRQTVDAVRPLAAEKGHAISLELAPVTIEADASRVRQIVLNLLSNAIKFTADGGAIGLSLEARADGAAILRVRDNGRGIAAADLDRIFEAFQQADAADGPGPARTPGHHEGTGLGLALTRQLVDAHGGTVSVRSQVGVGSEFTVVLPSGRATASEQAGPPVVRAAGPTVLVIEDDAAARELLRRHLESAGYAVVATPSGRQGLAWMAELRPDAVILDILLPDLDGWEILQRAKGDPAIRAIPIMVVSVVDNRQLGLALGAIDYFVKPVSRELLLEALGRLTFTTKVKSRTVTALVVDADPAAAARYRELLEPEGFRVIDAADGATGRARAVAEQPDLILLDAWLPDVDGFELASTLHHDPATASIPIWLTTPAGLAPEARARLSGTIQGVLSKGDDALAAMQAWLEVPRRPADTGEAAA